ncbi:MAG TPA: biotin/lipoyl-containing protein [Amycolatopsis sp.]|jgi:pyruvate/2-oxoglutarate dehydrogenase complex dihydrolipoamide acyltransferase (E2) component|nr:biotin/lipoyl-containing protein [Amycolatopsis sp.]
MSEIVVPKWGLTTEEVTLIEWYKQVGDRVEVDEPVAEVETDKVSQEIVSQVAGTITGLLVAEGAELKIGDPIARVDP